MSRALPSPAALELLGAGVTVVRLAQALDVSTGTASRYLSGQSRAPAEMRGAIAALIGPEAAARVMRRVREAVEAREVGEHARQRHLRPYETAQA